MAKKKGNRLSEANKFLDLLLSDCTGGAVGVTADVPLNPKYTPGERNGLCALAFKSVEMGLKSKEQEEPVSHFDKIRKNVYDSTKAWGRGDKAGSDDDGESPTHPTPSPDAEEGETDA